MATCPSSCARLKICRLDKCEARCCYDGAYLEDGEEEKIREAVSSAPELFAALPKEFIVDGSWGDHVSGRKTATAPYDFKAADFPAHFTQTRCVFAAKDHKCLLQMLAVSRGLHKWAYKPAACWMFPMQLVNDQPAPPPAPDEPDPHSLGDEYPGYSHFVPCGQHRKDGLPWQEVLAEEAAYWEKQQAKADAP
jgi:hypothetical protein